MITNRGKVFVKRFLAGQAGDAVGAISVGLGAAPEAGSDERLQFEWARTPVDLSAYDFTNDRLVFKGSLPEELEGSIYEIGLWTSEASNLAGSQESQIITSFDSDTEEWINATFSTQTRLGGDSLHHTPDASTSEESTMGGLTLDFIDYSAQDQFVLAYDVTGANVDSIKLQFRLDTSNYYEYTIAAPAAGYQFSELPKGDAVVVGAPDWDEINEIAIITTATAGGIADVRFDALRIDDMDTQDPEYGLIARFVPTTPSTKVDGATQDIEYSLGVSIP